MLCSDEIHSDLVLDALPHLPAAAFDGAADVTVTVTSPSKAYNLAGLGFSYAVIPDPGLRRRFCAAGEGFFEYDCPTLFGAWRVKRLTATEAGGWRSCSTTCVATATWSSGSQRSGSLAFR